MVSFSLSSDPTYCFNLKYLYIRNVRVPPVDLGELDFYSPSLDYKDMDYDLYNCNADGTLVIGFLLDRIHEPSAKPPKPVSA